MAQSMAQKKFFHMSYSIGASIVILGALFKILHISIGPLTGGMLLMIGLGVEALIFFISAFEPLVEDLDWSKVYPELAGGSPSEKKINQAKQAEEAKGLLSQKLDDMLKEAKLDSGLLKSLGDGIQSFAGAAQQIQPAVNSIAATNKYSEQIALATSQMESLNSLYKVQLEASSRQLQASEEVNKSIIATNKYSEQLTKASSQLESLNGLYKVQLENSGRQAQANEDVAKNASLLKEQMQSMATNLQSLNVVYGGMLTAMNRG